MSIIVETPKATARPLQVSMLTCPYHPLETLFTVWEQSRHNNPVPMPTEIGSLLSTAKKQDCVIESCQTATLLHQTGFARTDPNHPGWVYGLKEFSLYFRNTVRKLFTEDVPVTENLTFVFLIENMPISLREQLVRHRIGTALDPRLGADIVPNVSESSWWSQTTRVLDLSNFYDQGFFFVPEGLPNKRVEVEQTAWGMRTVNPLEEYHRHMKQTQAVYRDLVKAGVHVEDARQIIPLGMTHRITWEVNLKALTHIIGKRSCWIAQLGIWGEMITQIVECLSREIDPIFREIVNPPCIKGGKFASCPVSKINEERIDGRDGVMAPCPLWLFHNDDQARAYSHDCSDPVWMHTHDSRLDHGTGEFELFGEEGGEYSQISATGFEGGWWAKSKVMAERMQDGRLRFERLWNRDVDTGELLSEG